MINRREFMFGFFVSVLCLFNIGEKETLNNHTELKNKQKTVNIKNKNEDDSLFCFPILFEPSYTESFLPGIFG